MRPQIYVVEGKNDKIRLQSLFPKIDVLITNGSAIDLSTITILESLDETHDIILFFDPDHAGDRIRRILSQKLNHVYHAFIDQEDALSKNQKKVGVEHASDETIIKALHMMRQPLPTQSDITHAFLHDYDLTGSPYSTILRNQVSKTFHIGYINGKTLYQRLHLFGITQKDILEVLSESSSQEEIRTKFFKR